MARRHLAVATDEFRRAKRHHRTGGDVQTQIAKIARPRTHQNQRFVGLITGREAQDSVRTGAIKRCPSTNLAADGLADIADPAARRDHERLAILGPTSAMPTDAGKNHVLLQHIVTVEGVAPRSEDMDLGRLDHVEENGSEAPEILSRRETARRDEDEVPSLAQNRSAHGHEEGVDVRSTMDHGGRGGRTRIFPADLEVRRVGHDGVEAFRVPSEGESSIVRKRNPSVSQDEVRGLQVHGERDIVIAAPFGEVAENRPQRRGQAPVDFVGDQFDGGRLRIAGSQRFHGRATEDAGTGGRIKDSQFPSARLDPIGHKIGNGNRCKKEAVLLAVPIGLACRVPFADAVGVDHRSLTLAWSRYDERGGRVLPDSPIAHILFPRPYSHPAPTFPPPISGAVRDRQHIRGSTPSTHRRRRSGWVERARGFVPLLARAVKCSTVVTPDRLHMFVLAHMSQDPPRHE